MKFVVDANVLFALSKPSSVANSLFSKFSLKLFAPDFALIELHKYKGELSDKSGVDFNSVIKSIKEKVVFVDKSEYSGLIKEFSSKISDPKDVVYLALASRLNLPIWSNDKHFKEQSLISVFTTEELLELLSS
ncbi:MAG: hypothetical protein KKF74_02545 [Nanoarchaeota archaeon]|nr:hypothetical protein [Nanoarchaeota archaeon]